MISGISGIDDIYIHRTIQICVTLLVIIFANIIGRHLIEGVVRRSVRQKQGESRADEVKREDTLIGIFRTMITIALWVVAALVILGEMHINLSALLTGAGVFSVVFGFGAQNTIKDLIAGLYLLAENQYRVGDVVALSGGTTGLGTSGVVEEITLRITKLRDWDGNLNIVRNGEATVVKNQTFRFARVVIDIGVAYDASIDTAERVMNEVGLAMAGEEQWQKIVTEPIQFLRVTKFTDSAVVLEAIGMVKPPQQWSAAGEYRRRLLKAFAENDIEIGIPQIVVHQPKRASK